MVTSKRTGLVVLGLLVIAGLVTTLIWVPKIEVYGLNQVRHPQKISPAFYKRDVFTQEDRARQTLTTIVGGFLVLAGAYLTWRTVRATEDKQITDRFTAAVTNLSAEDKMAQRLGGIYALERIARDSPKDHWPVMEVLTAYVRDKCPKLKDEEPAAAENSAELDGPVEKVLPADIQAIMSVIRGRKAENDKLRKLDLHKANLNGANLSDTDLKGASFWRADLREASFWGANLRGADLKGADLREASFFKADLRGAYIKGADLRGAKLWEAKLADCKRLTQEQLDSAYQGGSPASLPPHLHFPAQPALPTPPAEPPVMPPAAPRPPTTPAGFD